MGEVKRYHSKAKVNMRVCENLCGEYRLFNEAVGDGITFVGEGADRLIRSPGFVQGDLVKLTLTLEPVDQERPIWDLYG